MVLWPAQCCCLFDVIACLLFLVSVYTSFLFCLGEGFGYGVIVICATSLFSAVFLFLSCDRTRCTQKKIIAVFYLFAKFGKNQSGNRKSCFGRCAGLKTRRRRCEADEFKCGTLQCIAASKVCNNVRDCDDASDEIGCRKFSSAQLFSSSSRYQR